MKDVPFKANACSADSLCKNSMYADLINQKGKKKLNQRYHLTEIQS
jgi:hypothetical protein